MMNPVFILLVVLGLVSVWFLLSFTFPWIGSLFKKIYDDTKYNITKEDTKEQRQQDER